MKRPLLVLSALLIPFWAVGQSRDQVAASKPLDDIVARGVAAAGGEKTLTAVTSERMSGKIILASGVSAPLTVELKRPNKIHTEIAFPKGTFIQAYDGVSGWEVNTFVGKNTPIAMSPAEAKEVAETADMDGPLVQWKKKGSRLVLAGRENVGGNDAFKIGVTLADGNVRTLYLDARSYQKVKWEGELDRGGKKILFESFFSDYRKVDGIPFPFRIRSDAGEQGRGQEIVFNKIEVNPVIPDSEFALPAGKTNGP